MRIVAAVACALAISTGAAHAKHHHRIHHHRHHHHTIKHRSSVYRGTDSRPAAWCGWYARHRLVSHDPGPAFNLARNWARWGKATVAHIGALVVWPHHVGKIVG